MVLGSMVAWIPEMRRTLDEFLSSPTASGESVEVVSNGGAFIRLHVDTVSLYGDFTPYELIRIIAAFNQDKKVDG